MPVSSCNWDLNSCLKMMDRMVKRQPTLTIDNVPCILQEPGIKTGYRIPNQPWGYYLKSAFQLHNETMNFWTHFIGALVVIQQVYVYLTAYGFSDNNLGPAVVAAGYSFFFTSWISAFAHLLHSKSLFDHYVVFMLDNLSAPFSMFGAGIVAMYGCSDPKFYASVGDWYLICQGVAVYTSFVITSFAKLWYGDIPRDMRRKYMIIAAYAVHCVLDICPIFPRYMKCLQETGCSLYSLQHMTNVVLLIMAQGLTYALHQPELTWPGKFDVFGHSHQWFHVIISIIHVSALRALYIDFKDGWSGHCHPDAFSICITILSVTFAGIVTLFYLARLVQKSNKKQ